MDHTFITQKLTTALDHVITAHKMIPDDVHCLCAPIQCITDELNAAAGQIALALLEVCSLCPESQSCSKNFSSLATPASES